MKLTNIRPVGRFRNEKTKQEVNIHRGRQVGRSVDVSYFLQSGRRVLVSEADLYGGDWKRI